MVENNKDNNTENVQTEDLEDKTIKVVEGFVNTKDYSNEYSINDNKANAIICYIPFLFIINLVTGKYKKSNYVKFHTNQGLLVTIVYIVTWIISIILESIFRFNNGFNMYTPEIIYYITFLIFCIGFCASFFGILNTMENRSKELPIIGRFRIIR